MPNYKTLEIKNISEYIALIDRIKISSEEVNNKADLIFRGQGADRPLLPKLSRLTLNGPIKKIEELILKEFERGILPLSEFQPTNDWDMLALAQHHGLPTRLLDWTYSALVALWFAVRKAPRKNEKTGLDNGVVWILNATTADFRTDTDLISPFSNNLTKIFRSRVVSRRISAQSGIFTVHKINEEGKMISLERNKDFSPKLTKAIINPKEFASIRKQLHTLGVNNASVFPDIDGYCAHLEWRYSKMSDEIEEKSFLNVTYNH
ncbi:MAG: FRG domain-containing protein [Candidatus Pedobacter colombiensis]|uniref:FRG domain-containing protein n=1 Tax=Candidatus Pedobacter colombiensis TaxID=3121371 RepID=A0AAJ5W4A2_9SPHI|nr:FRG domain-containing protein [Pedobacter sp.]WEK17886.1 MAG: FRG domain-containing protein [Pedobacter sp.]